MSEPSTRLSVRVLLVDPSPLFYAGIRDCLSLGRHVPLGQVGNLEEALRQADTLHPDLIIVGPHLAEQGLIVCREITKRLPTLKIIIFTEHANELLFQADAVYAGVAACVSPEITDEECLAVIGKVMAGAQLFSHEILSVAFQPIGLTPREREVLKLMAEGKTDRQIARALNLSYSTVRNHAQRILNKLNVHHQQEAVWRARHRGMV